MDRAIGFRTSGLRGVPILEALKGIRSSGYGAVEFCLEHPGSSVESLSAAREMGLSVSSVSYHGKADPFGKRLEMGRRAVEMAAECGVGTVLLGSPATGEEPFRREAVALYGMCSASGLKPAWETEPGTVLDSLEDHGRIIAPLGPDAGINLDIGHMHLQGTCTEEHFKALAGRIHHVHVEGMRRGVHRHLVPGEGDLDWAAALSGLDSAGYSGPLVIDLFEIPADWRGFIRRANIALCAIIGYPYP
jgi:sugar phosphate isomerase/epimerase